MYEKQKTQTDVTDSLSLQFFDMCSSVHHLFVIPFSFEEVKLKSYDELSYVLLTYTTQYTTVQDLIHSFQRIMPQFRKKEALRLTFSKGYLIPNGWTIRDMKRYLNRRNIEGIVLLIFDDCSRLTASQKFQNETCLEDYLKIENQYHPNLSQLQLKFILPGQEQNLIIVSINHLNSTQKLIQQFFKQVERQFNVQLSSSSIEKFIIKKNQANLIEDVRIDKNGLNYGDEIIVVFFDKERKFVRQNLSQDKCFIIYDFDGNPKSNFIKISYKTIKFDTLNSFYQKYFGYKPIQNDRFYLKVMDLIIEQNQTLEKAEEYFKQLAEEDKITIVGYIIKQKVLFYSRMNSNLEDSLIEYSQIEPDQTKRSHIEQQISTRASQLKGDKYIKEKSHLEPIYLYTSQVRLGNLTIYEGVNSYLRSTSVTEIVRMNSKEEWQYRFVKTLFKRIGRIQNTKFKVVYRGVNYIPPEKIGQIIKFPSFISTSLDQKIAYKLPLQLMRTKNIHGDQFSFFIMKIKRGKLIAKYSAKRSQKEVLLEPFSQFLVTKITHKTFKYLSQDFPFTVFELQQVNFQDCKFPQIKVTFLLWIDDKRAEGQCVYNKITQIRQPLIFKQFLSTEHFRNWLLNNQYLLKDRTANLVVISNMKRQENGVSNPTAGLQSLKELRSYSLNVPVMFYVGHVEGTRAHLKNAGLTDNVQVCRSQKQLIMFIQKHTTIQFPAFQKKQQWSCTIQ